MAQEIGDTRCPLPACCDTLGLEMYLTNGRFETDQAVLDKAHNERRCERPGDGGDRKIEASA